MRQKTKHNLFYAGSAIATILLLRANKKRKEKVWIYNDHDMRNSVEVDENESPNAPMDSAEKGLTELDAAYRSEWVSMGYPQTHRDLGVEGKS